MGIINKYTLADVSSARWTFKDILENFGEIEAIIYIDFPDLKEDYNKYMNTISEALYWKKESSYTNSWLYYKKLLYELEKTIETYRCEFLK